ncbi:hypothetical protein OK016_09145 [Vibrio chagasii]|nr:hypothetical protein [Vibrio chagasii]
MIPIGPWSARELVIGDRLKLVKQVAIDAIINQRFRYFSIYVAMVQKHRLSPQRSS